MFWTGLLESLALQQVRNFTRLINRSEYTSRTMAVVAVDSIMRTKVITVSLGDSLQLTIRKMNQSGIGSIVVEDDGKPVGIITERDILRLIEHGRNPIPIDLTVDTVMTTPIHTIQGK